MSATCRCWPWLCATAERPSHRALDSAPPRDVSVLGRVAGQFRSQLINQIGDPLGHVALADVREQICGRVGDDLAHAVLGPVVAELLVAGPARSLTGGLRVRCM